MWRGEAYTEICWGNLTERDHLQDAGVDGKIILRSVISTSSTSMQRGGKQILFFVCRSQAAFPELRSMNLELCEF